MDGLNKEEKEVIVPIIMKKLVGMRWVLDNKEVKDRDALMSRVRRVESALRKLNENPSSPVDPVEALANHGLAARRQASPGERIGMGEEEVSITDPVRSP